jgi:hypothetical protein
MPFKTGARQIVVVRDIPLRQCRSCSGYVIEDAVMAQIDGMLAKANQQAELEIVRYAA